jgi:hypothetical protein
MIQRSRDPAPGRPTAPDKDPQKPRRAATTAPQVDPVGSRASTERLAEGPLTIQFRRRPLIVSLLLFVAVLVAMNLALSAYEYFEGPESSLPGTVLHAFNLDSGDSIATWFAVILLAVCSVLLTAITYFKRIRRDRFFWHWLALAVIFGLMSMDEGAELHARLIEPLRAMWDPGGFLYMAWVIPAAIAVFLFVLAYIPFLLHLSNRFRTLFIVSGAIYVGGALGLEMLGGYFLDTYGSGVLTRLTMITEETFEKVGAIVFIYTLLTYLKTMRSEIGVEIR